MAGFKMRAVVFGTLGLVLATSLFLLGFSCSVSMHGDWIPTRNNGGQCVAFNPDTARPVGTWTVAKDGRCHMSAFIWQQIEKGLPN
jgi:hypothetical protein